MSDMTLSLACLPTDRSRAVLEGRIRIPGVSIRPMPGTPGEIFRNPQHQYTRTLLSAVLNLDGEFPYEDRHDQ